MKRWIIILSVTLFSGFANAGNVTTKISRLSTATEQYSNALLDGVAIDLTGHPCAVSTTLVSWDVTTGHGKNMLSLALAGMLANKRLYILYSDTQCGLWGNQVLVTRIDVLNN